MANAKTNNSGGMEVGNLQAEVELEGKRVCFQLRSRAEEARRDVFEDLTDWGSGWDCTDSRFIALRAMVEAQVLCEEIGNLPGRAIEVARLLLSTWSYCFRTAGAWMAHAWRTR